MNQVKLVLYLSSFLYNTSFMAIMIHVSLRYAEQDIFEDYSSNHAKRGAPLHHTVFFRGRS